MFYRLDFSALFWEALTVWSQWDLFLLRFSKGMFSLFVKCFYAAHGYCTLCFLEKNALCFIAGFKRDNWGFILMDGVSTWLCFKFLFLYAWQMTQLHLLVHLTPIWLEMSSRIALVALFLKNWILCSWWLNLGFGWQQCFTIRNCWDCSNLGFRDLCCPLGHHSPDSTTELESRRKALVSCKCLQYKKMNSPLSLVYCLCGW